MSDPIDRMQKSWSDMMTISRLETEITRLRTLLSEVEKEARAKALEDAAKFIEDFVVTSTNRGPLVKPRDGNVYAIHYAEKIRGL